MPRSKPMTAGEFVDEVVESPDMLPYGVYFLLMCVREAEREDAYVQVRLAVCSKAGVPYRDCNAEFGLPDSFAAFMAYGARVEAQRARVEEER